jgi:hypothetical protein
LIGRPAALAQDVDRVPFLLQSALDETRYFTVVFDDKNTHRFTPAVSPGQKENQCFRSTCGVDALEWRREVWRSCGKSPRCTGARIGSDESARLLD